MLLRIMQLSEEFGLEPGLLISKPMDIPQYHCVWNERQIAVNLGASEKILRSVRTQGRWKQCSVLEKHLRDLE